MLAALLALMVATSGAAQTPTYAPGAVFVDCKDCPELVVIPAGRFVMGSAESEVDHEADESPQHEVRFAKPFSISRFEVTRGQYAAFAAATGRSAGASCSIWVWDGWKTVDGKSWKDPGFAQDDTHPVVCVDWFDAEAYAAWLATTTGLPYRLPTEAEWEYAARAGTTTPYITGSDPHQLCRTDNGHDATSKEAHLGMKWPPVDCRDGFAETAPVGSFPANAFGVHDVHGNVWEWMRDCYTANYENASATGAAVEASDCKQRVYRGGGWSVERRGRRSANRGRYDIGGRYGQLGLRIVRDLP